jgi:hypothetical protein
VKHHQELLTAAIECDGEGQQALMAGDRPAAREAFLSAADLYRQSWEEAPPRSYGRLVGMLKATALSGEDPASVAEYAREALAEDPGARDSPTAAYALALAALVESDDEGAGQLAEVMRSGSDAFDRAATAIRALAAGNASEYADAVGQIVRDFEQRSSHLTGVAIADTALVLERLAARRNMAAGLRSDVLPA